MADLDRSFIEKIVELATPVKMTIDGVEYASKALVDPRKPEPVVTPLGFHTLKALVDYLEENVDVVDKTTLMIHVVNHAKVELISKVEGRFRQRETLARVEYEGLFGQGFDFGVYANNENFIVALQALFVPTIERDEVLRVVGNIKQENVEQHTDDGKTQTVTARQGIALAVDLDVPNPVRLRPYRTFRELEQPESLFVLRLRQRQGQKPECALFESDGGAWRLEAIKSVREWLLSEGVGEAILA